MSVNEPWIDRVERRLARWCDHGLGKAWMVAVSSGGDSVGLLRVLHHLAGPLGLQLSVAHLDHGRGARRHVPTPRSRRRWQGHSTCRLCWVHGGRRAARISSPTHAAPVTIGLPTQPAPRGLGHRGWPHARRSSRDDPPSHRPRNRSPRTGRHAPNKDPCLEATNHPGTPAAWRVAPRCARLLGRTEATVPGG